MIRLGCIFELMPRWLQRFSQAECYSKLKSGDSCLIESSIVLRSNFDQTIDFGCLFFLKGGISIYEIFFSAELSLQFIEWLHSVCMNNLVPGACYQRRKTCLEVLAILYETFQYNEKAKQRKSFTPGMCCTCISINIGKVKLFIFEFYKR